MLRMRRSIALYALMFLAATLSRQAAGAEYDPPEGYYSTATGTDTTLKTQLRTIISTMVNVSYDNARFSAPYTDPDPDVPGNILLIYDRDSVDETWDTSPLIWNREHIWPQSRLGTASDSDQFNLRPSDPGINSNRGNDAFGLDTNTGSHRSVGANHYYPGDADAGDVARAQFYMATRYSSLSLTDSSLPSTGGTQMGDLSSLLRYHYRDVPDTFERRRNHAIFGLAGAGAPAITNPYRQQNRNPFVDRPEFAWSIFADQANDSQLYVGGSPNASGGSTLDLDFGSVIVGAAVPDAPDVALNKNGLDGTYFEVTTSGIATSPMSGRYNAFQILTSGTDSRTLSVELDTDTVAAGPRTGTVIVNNLDITTLGGSGRGNNDANDVINLSLDVLSHANPSFVSTTDNSLTHDFGTVTLGSVVPAFQFDIANLVGTMDFTAKLDLDSILVSGDVAQLPTNLAPFNGGSALEAGFFNSFTAAIDTSVVGSFSATYTMNFSDEDLAGAIGLGSLTLNLIGSVENTFVPTADFDEDGDVDGRDFLAWQRGESPEPFSTIDLAAWQQQYGPGELVAAVAVPEPATFAIVALVIAFWSCPLQRTLL